MTRAGLRHIMAIAAAGIIASLTVTGAGIAGTVTEGVNKGSAALTVEKTRPRPVAVRVGTSDADYAVQTILAERRADGTIFAEVFVVNNGSEWGYSGTSIPVNLQYYGQQIGAGSFSNHSPDGRYGLSIATSRSFPVDRRLRLSVAVDPGGVVAETNEKNNGCFIELLAGETFKRQECR